MAAIIPTLSIAELQRALTKVKSWNAIRNVLPVVGNIFAENLLAEIIEDYRALVQFVVVDSTPETRHALNDLQTAIDRKEVQILALIVD